MKNLILLALLIGLTDISCTLSTAAVSEPIRQPAPTPASQQVTVTADEAVNVRAEATEHSRDIGDLLHGQTVTLYFCQDGWGYVRAGEVVGWVKAKYIGGCK